MYKRKMQQKMASMFLNLKLVFHSNIRHFFHKTKSNQKEDLLTFNTLKVGNEKFINKNFMKWIFLHWPCYRSSAYHILMAQTCLGPRKFVLGMGSSEPLKVNHSAR